MKTLSQLKPRMRRVFKNLPDGDTKLLINLRVLRKEKGISLRHAAIAAEVSPATLCRLEAGGEASLPVALRIAAFVELPVESIWGLKPLPRTGGARNGK